MNPQFQFESLLFPLSNTINPINIEEQINLFLGISPPSKIKLESTQINHPINHQLVTNLNNQFSLKTENLETDHKSDSNFTTQPILIKKSKHHNFQKHTVTALKNIINQNQFEKYCENLTTLKITKTLWKSFNNIKTKNILTKKFLSILFTSDPQNLTNLKQYGFNQLFQQFSLEDIQISKNQLRLIVIKLFTNQNIKSHVEKRSIQRKQEFKLYLINFREELKTSNMKKRISKESSDWIHTNAQINDWIL